MVGCCAIVIMSSCAKKLDRVQVDPPPEEIPVSLLPPVETLPKVAPEQIPSFPFQTRVGSVQTTTPLNVKILTSDLSYPWSMAFLPDGRMLVTEKPGNIRIVTASGAIGNKINGVPAVKYRSDSGLQDIVLDPDFATTRLVFWSFVEPLTATDFITSIARAKLSADETTFEDVTIIYRATPSYTGVQHPGSQLLFDKNGYLFACFGERYDDGIRIKAQAMDSPLGKIVRIKKDGSAAPGNPFSGQAGVIPELWSLGHRDPQGLAFNPATGELWEAEHGPMAGDEINLIKRGANYGWPVIAYGLENSGPLIGTTVGNGTQQSGMVQPIYYWDPAIAPSAIAFYTGTLVPEWKNNLFVAALKGRHIIRLVISNNKVVGEERLLATEGQRMRKVIQGPDGALYALTDMPKGRIYRISN
ncbi:glucose dehydrogenase [Mucilaginibacter pedocola]|uniref:Glucose dehydrogenase n=1 Tax=Mucilaginibacter pedocola TaxID=1792845 RepID=A0A1S9PIG1_9SPHI|nr:glucose dehydrogenase [Mucilaginibacter pedocola]